MMKKIGDGMSLDTEILFGTQEDIAIRYKLFFVSIHSPSFVGKCEDRNMNICGECWIKSL